MDTETLKLLISLGEHGGSVAMLIAVFIGGRASRMAQEAVKTLKNIESGLVSGLSELRMQAAKTEDKLNAIHEDIEKLPLALFRSRRELG